MDRAARGEVPAGGGAAPDNMPVERAVPLQLVTERVVLSALREQDAADAAEMARGRAQFLADASLRFGESLDQEITYAAIAGVALPGLDAWCIVDVVQLGGGLRRLAVVHPDEGKQAAADELAGRWKPAVDDPIGVPAVMRDRKPVIVIDRVDALVSAATRDPDTLKVLHVLGAGSVLVVPLVGHGDLLGAITYVSRPSAPGYSPDDILLAEALATRCAQALEGAKLYAAARASWLEAEKARGDAEVARADAEAARAEAEAANATKAKFLSTMSHELRTPLNAISGYTQLMEMGLHGPVTPEQHRDLASIRRSQAHLLGLVDSVLNYAQLEAGHVVYTLIDLNLVQLVEDVQLLMVPLMRTNELDYAFETCVLPLRAHADPEKVRQIVLNLLGNAAKFTPSGGHVTLTCGEAAGHDDPGRPMLTVTVTDSGVGIPAEKLESVFEPFMQINRGLTTSDVGVGLGLAVSRDLARGMGGNLTVQSTPGDGSIFTLMILSA